MPRRHTPYYHKLVALGAELVDRIGYDAALRFTTVAEEHLATRERVGVYDVYHQGALDLKGPDAEALLSRLLVNDPARLDDGGVLYSSLCNEAGGMVDDLTVYRLAGDHFWLCPTPSRVDAVDAWIRDHIDGQRAYLTNIVSGTAFLSLQGPRSRETLAAMTDLDLSTAALPYYRFTRGAVAEVPTLVARTGYSGELGYELFFPREYAEHMWDAAFAAGEPFGIAPCGLGRPAVRPHGEEVPALRPGPERDDQPARGLPRLDGPLREGRRSSAATRCSASATPGVTRRLVGIELGPDDPLPEGRRRDHGGRRTGRVGHLLRYRSRPRPDPRDGLRRAGRGGRRRCRSASSPPRRARSCSGVVRLRAFYDPDRTVCGLIRA